MVGIFEPNSSKSDSSKQPKEIKIEEYIANPLQIRIPAKGKYSPKTDERCVTWCSQSVRGRHEGQEPWCRSLCIRRVFDHEVERLTSHFSRDSAFQLHAAAARERERQGAMNPAMATSSAGGSSGLASSTPTTTRSTTERFPLPPEGQPSSALSSETITSSSSASPPSFPDPDSDPDSTPHEVSGIVGGPRTRGVRYWQPGWYVWCTRHPWAVQERVELMALDLARQTEWMRVKEQERRAWAAEEVEHERERRRGQREMGFGSGMGSGAGADGLAEDGEEGGSHPYLAAAEESFLVRIPTQLPPLDMYVRRAFTPTWTVLGITKESVASGHQRELAEHAWSLVREGAPFRLVKNVFKTCFSSFGKKQDD